MTAATTSLTSAPILIGALIAAVIVVIAIAWGIRSKRRRVQAQQEFEAHAEEAGVEMAAPEAPVPPPSLPAPSAPPSPRAIAETPTSDTPKVEEEPAPRPLADEPIAAVATFDGASGTLAADAEAPASPSPADGPVTQLKGLGPKVAARLGELGIDRVGQIAALDDAGITALDARMGPFIGRITRDRWVEQARLLASGDREGFERVFGRL